MHSAIDKPQMAFVSKQLTRVLPAQSERANLLPLLPRFDARLCVKVEVLWALAAALLSATTMQLTKLSGLPRTMATITNARRSAVSNPAMINRPRFARA